MTARRRTVKRASVPSRRTKSRPSRKGGCVRLWAALATVIFCVYYAVIGAPYLARHYAYPLEYSEYIYASSQENRVPFSLVAAVILAESKFDEDAESEPGALGLMQLMPETARWIAEQRGQAEPTEADIKSPRKNIDAGTWYLSYLSKEFGGNVVLTLAAYNAGRGHVEEWVETYGWTSGFDDIDVIPFPETRTYVRRVLDYREHYESLYR